MSKNNSSQGSAYISRILHYFWCTLMRYKWRSFTVLILMPINIFLSTIIVPYLTSSIIGHLSSGNLELSNYLALIAAIICVLIAQRFIIEKIIEWLDWTLDAKGGKYLSELIFDAIVNQSMDFHRNHFSGSLTSQANKFSRAFINLKSDFVWGLYPLVVAVIIIFVSIFRLSPIFSIVLISYLATFTAVSLFIFTKTRHLDVKLPQAENRQTGRLSDVIGNIINVKSYANENFERKFYQINTDATKNATYTKAKVSILRHLSLDLINTVAMLAFMILIITSAKDFNLSVTNIVFIYSLTISMLGQAWNIPRIFRRFNQSLGDAKDAIQILDSKITVPNFSKKRLKLQAATIDFNHIYFQHKGSDDAIFRNFNLHIKAGERIGLVGISGSGKSTLAKLLLRFSDIQKGEILIGGQNIKNVSQQSLRQHIAYVPQESSLFHRSIAENIAYAKPSAKKGEIMQAAKLANAHDFIQKLSHKYRTQVGERGAKLSGGERQRIAIARAILKNAPILILDEATSALDSKSESAIQTALDNLMQDRTSIVIAHRLSTIANLDRIVVLKGGKIIEQGSHNELLKKSGEYAKLWQKQSGAFLDLD